MTALTDSDLIDIRRHLHQNPELSNQEHATADFIERKLHQFGVSKIDRVAETGVVALIEGAKPGPNLAWRADIDALPIDDVKDVPYRSTRDGVMHACGHDVHTTVALGIAAELQSRTNELNGSVKLIFQPAEEASPGDSAVGAEKMVQCGVLNDPDVDAIFALHCMPDLEVGHIGHTGGPVWASSDVVRIRVDGTATHGAYPHNGVDAIYVGSQLVTALQSIPSRRIDSREANVVSICQFHAGESYNVLPDQAMLEGLFRSYSESVASNTRENIRRMATNICEGYGATCDIEFSRGSRPVLNNENLESVAVKTLASITGSDAIVRHDPQMGAEDFASFSRRIPGCYLFLGTKSDPKSVETGLHSADFDVDEKCLGFGASTFAKLLCTLSSKTVRELTGQATKHSTPSGSN